MAVQRKSLEDLLKREGAPPKKTRIDTFVEDVVSVEEDRHFLREALADSRISSAHLCRTMNAFIAQDYPSFGEISVSSIRDYRSKRWSDS